MNTEHTSLILLIVTVLAGKVNLQLFSIASIVLNATALLEQIIIGRTVDTKFLLYTSLNPNTSQYLATNDSEAVRNSNFNPLNPTRFLIHGWLGDASFGIGPIVKDAYLSRGDYNVFVVDWSSGAQTLDYVYAVANVYTAGSQIAMFIDFLNENHNLQFETVYLIGHSLGGQIAGITGKRVQRGRIDTIFGLDAADYPFNILPKSARLAAGDAVYVEGIYTNAGGNGILIPYGNSSFYPNWGNSQPGCFTIGLGICSHLRAYDYFAESLRGVNEFLGKRCANFSSILLRSCAGGGPQAYMGGDPSNHSTEGFFYVPVNSRYPYATGTIN